MLKTRQEAKMSILRSRSGTYHLGGSYAAMCNSRGGIIMSAATKIAFDKASSESFCKKCFPNGKPQSVVEV